MMTLLDALTIFALVILVLVLFKLYEKRSNIMLQLDPKTKTITQDPNFWSGRYKLHQTTSIVRDTPDIHDLLNDLDIEFREWLQKNRLPDMPLWNLYHKFFNVRINNGEGLPRFLENVEVRDVSKLMYEVAQGTVSPEVARFVTVAVANQVEDKNVQYWAKRLNQVIFENLWGDGSTNV